MKKNHLYVGLKIMAYKSAKDYIFTNSQELTVTSFTEYDFTVKDNKWG